MDSEFFDDEAEIGGVKMPILAGDMNDPEELMKNLAEAMKDEAPLDRNRPYQCQQPRRHQVLVEGLTMRDVADCFARGILLCTGIDQPELYDKVMDGTCCHDDLYKVDFEKIDPVAALQNAGCEIEKMMGIYPNVID